MKVSIRKVEKDELELKDNDCLIDIIGSDDSDELQIYDERNNLLYNKNVELGLEEEFEYDEDGNMIREIIIRIIIIRIGEVA